MYWQLQPGGFAKILYRLKRYLNRHTTPLRISTWEATPHSLISISELILRPEALVRAALVLAASGAVSIQVTLGVSVGWGTERPTSPTPSKTLRAPLMTVGDGASARRTRRPRPPQASILETSQPWMKARKSKEMQAATKMTGRQALQLPARRTARKARRVSWKKHPSVRMQLPLVLL